MTTIQTDREEDTTNNKDESDAKIEQIIRRERELKQAKQEARQQTPQSDASRSISDIHERLTQPATGKVIDIVPIEEDKIKLVVDIDGLEISEKLRVPQSGDEYRDNPKLVRLLEYIRAERTDISALRGEQIPIRKAKQKTYKIVAPTQFNSVARGIFSVWQSMFRYRMVKKERGYRGYADGYNLTERGLVMIAPFSTVIGLGGSKLLLTLSAQSVGVLYSMFGLMGAVLLAVGIASTFTLGYASAGWLLKKSAEGLMTVRDRLKQLSPF